MLELLIETFLIMFHRYSLSHLQSLVTVIQSNLVNGMCRWTAVGAWLNKTAHTACESAEQPSPPFWSQICAARQADTCQTLFRRDCAFVRVTIGHTHKTRTTFQSEVLLSGQGRQASLACLSDCSWVPPLLSAVQHHRVVQPQLPIQCPWHGSVPAAAFSAHAPTG